MQDDAESLMAEGMHDQVMFSPHSSEADWLNNVLQLPVKATWLGTGGYVRLQGNRLCRITLRQGSPPPGMGTSAGACFDGVLVEIYSLVTGHIMDQVFLFRDYLAAAKRQVMTMIRGQRGEMSWRGLEGAVTLEEKPFQDLQSAIMHFFDLCSPEVHHTGGLTNRIRRKRELNSDQDGLEERGEGQSAGSQPAASPARSTEGSSDTGEDAPIVIEDLIPPR